MTTEIFALWFQNFTKQVEERPLLVIYDGHLTHVSLELIEKAIKEKITIVKLPPHVTDRLQPLDVCCFGPLKHEWEKKLNKQMNLLGPRETVSKSVFVDVLSNIWHKNLSEKNITSGFRATGIFPLNHEKYPQDHFDQRLLKRYNNWVRLGKLEDITEDLSTAVVTPTKGKLPEPQIDHSFAKDQNHSECIAGPSLQLQGTSLLTNGKTIVVPTDTSTPQPLKSPCYCSELGPMPPQIASKTWVPAWTLRDNKSFSELVLDKMKGPTEKQPVKHRKIDKKMKVITDEVYAQEIQQMHEKQPQKKSMSTKLQKKSVKKKIEYKMSDSTTNSSNDESENKYENEIEESSNEEQSDPESKFFCLEDKLVSLWGDLSPPTKEENLIRKRYGYIYENFSKPKHSKKQTLYIGKILRRFLSGRSRLLKIESRKWHYTGICT